MKYDYIVYIGTFQFLTKQEVEIMKKSLELANNLIVCIGSINLPRSPKNPFNQEERTSHIFGSLPEKFWDRVSVIGVEDMIYNESEWIIQVRQKVQEIANGGKIALIGYDATQTNFPSWETIITDKPEYSSDKEFIWSMYFDQKIQKVAQVHPCFPLSEYVREYLKIFQKTEHYRQISKKLEFINKYKESWSSAPYPPTFVTVDSVVIVGGHILLIRRKAEPGKGLYALPGGFIGADEELKDAAIRELREEAGIKVPSPVLYGAIVNSEVFAHPERSMRGRTITHSYLIHLKNETVLPRIKGGDDADKAIWVPLDAIDGSKLFEDHYSIIKKMIKDV